jgi:hypothetical protein
MENIFWRCNSEHLGKNVPPLAFTEISEFFENVVVTTTYNDGEDLA